MLRYQFALFDRPTNSEGAIHLLVLSYIPTPAPLAHLLGEEPQVFGTYFTFSTNAFIQHRETPKRLR